MNHASRTLHRTLTRLLGLIASVSDHSHDEDVEKVAQLVSSYISRPSCIILLTVACECKGYLSPCASSADIDRLFVR